MRNVSLDDKYALREGRILLSGTQALVRLLITQRQRDVAEGLRTAGYVSGYRGSPLGALDRELWQAEAILEAHDIVFRPGVNEDLAATAIWGTQQLGLFPGAKAEGVFSLWYGKGPGVDRSGDVLKHANLAGTAQHGGVLLAFGDDHSAESSTLAHQSEPTLIAAMIPILNPATVGEIIEFGHFGWAMSRYSGLWVGVKCVNETVGTTASVDVQIDAPRIRFPADIELPAAGVHIRSSYAPQEDEQRLLQQKLPLALAFARSNGLDRIIFRGDQRRLGIVTTGKAYGDVKQGLALLGIDVARARALGMGLYKVGLVWPLEPESMRAFAAGFEELLFVEEKRPLIEDQAARWLYDLPSAARPRLVGKRDEAGVPLLPADGVLTPGQVASVIGERLARLDNLDATLRTRVDCVIRAFRSQLPSPAPIARVPYFCSGCPHNRSTRVPEGSRAMAGIGCAYMAVWMDRETMPSVQMGGEGANWNGISPFTETPHVFQNLGDGTYFHSGLLAIRAAVTAGVNITYKVLYNDAVAMTGGQPVEGHLTVAKITRQVRAEGVGRIDIVTDDPERYTAGTGLADAVTVHSRADLDAVQGELRATPGTSVLIYDQGCAAEKRRKRKRGTDPDPLKRVFINDTVCEGCGDCSERSNCVSVLPLETTLGRKRRIDQSACNMDFSCLDGFCPSFVTVHGGQLRVPRVGLDIASTVQALPEPELPHVSPPYNILFAGIGGTGVVTASAILAMAAHLEDRYASVSDMTGLAQKNGAVFSHLRIADVPESLNTVRIGNGGAHLLVGCDLVASGSNEALRTVKRGLTHVVVNAELVPTGDFQRHKDMSFHETEIQCAISRSAGEDNVDYIDATRTVASFFPDTASVNLFILGYAYQQGCLPLSARAIARAIEINGVAIDNNKSAFSLGRLACHSPEKLSGAKAPWWACQDKPETLEALIRHRAASLTQYQNASYAKRYTDFVNEVRAAENAKVPGADNLTKVVAKALYKLMAYKDEYEVARLYTDGDFQRKLDSVFEGDFQTRFHFAPPILARRDPRSGEPRKMAIGAWAIWGLRALAKLKRFRATPLDVFGYSHERRVEQRLASRYRAMIRDLLGDLDPERHPTAVALAELGEQVRGFGHIKTESLKRVAQEEQHLLRQYYGAEAIPTSAFEYNG